MFSLQIQFVLKLKLVGVTILHLRVYADAVFASNLDFSSHVDFVIMLRGCRNTAHVAIYLSRKSRIVVQSIMRCEIFALPDGFDRAFMIHHHGVSWKFYC